MTIMTAATMGALRDLVVNVVVIIGCKMSTSGRKNFFLIVQINLAGAMVETAHPPHI